MVQMNDQNFSFPLFLSYIRFIYILTLNNSPARFFKTSDCSSFSALSIDQDSLAYNEKEKPNNR